MEVVAGNVLIGGLTAATRALLSRKDPWKAFSVGALGGAVHVGGKYLAVRRGTANGWVGVAVASTGTSIVSNAGRGVSPYKELSLPLASARLRVTPGEARKVRLVVNGFESVLIGSAALTNGLTIDWKRTLSTGAVVFETRGLHLVTRGQEVSGLAWGPVVLLDPLSYDADLVMRHEVVHVHQHRFAAEAWARPIEEFLRAKIPGGRAIPSWLEIGLESAIWIGDTSHRFGFARLTEAEAERLERR
jgi:hypothetical protein